MKRTTRNAERTKKEIIEKSAPVFNVHGYAGTKMQMLIDATGYQMGGIYRHFDTKMDLAKEVFKYSYKTQIRVNLEVDSSLNPKEKLLTILRNYTMMIYKPRIIGGCPILNTATEVDDTNEDFRKLTKNAIHEVVGIIESIIEEGKSKGTFQPTIDSKKEASYIFATMEGAILMGKISRDSQIILDVFGKIEAYLEEKVFNLD